MLPTISRINKDQLLKELDNPQQCFSENTGTFLIGVLNIKTNKVYLLPCIQDKVWLEMDNNGRYVKGWKFLKGMKKGEEIPEQDVLTYNNNPYPPRVISVTNSSPEEENLRSHTFVLEVLNDLDNREDYRGFSVKPGKDNEPTVYQWDSTSLNQTWDDLNPSKVLLMKHQSIVRNALEPSPSLGKKDEFKQVFIKLRLACAEYKSNISNSPGTPADITDNTKLGTITSLENILNCDDYSDDTARFNAFNKTFRSNKSSLTKDNDTFGVLFVKVVSALLCQGISSAYKTWKNSTRELNNVENIEKNIEVGQKLQPK